MHGCDGLAMRMLEAIRHDIRHNGGDSDAIVIGLGDYVDRGDASAALLSRLAALSADTEFRFIAIKGNHEDLFISFLENPDEDLGWLEMGGVETLWSFGLKYPATGSRRPKLRELRDALATRLSTSTLSFLQNLRTHAEFGDFFFSHAGAKPGLALKDQRARDLMWHRFDSRDPDPSFGRILVHGHSPVLTPDFRVHRVNIDTGAYATGRLTCLVLEGDTRQIIEVTNNGFSAKQIGMVT
jgi:serine/threonine protein phosphatase 1